MQRFKYSQVFKVLSFVVLLSGSVSAEGVNLNDSQLIDRMGQDSRYSAVDPSGWGLRLNHIVLRSAEDSPTDFSSWRFGRINLGMVVDLQFQIRDPRGIVPVTFVQRGDTLLMQLISNPNIQVPLATIGLLDMAHESWSHSGENIHKELRFKIPDLRIVREDSRTFHEYSILLPALFESLVESAVSASDQGSSGMAECARDIASLGDPAGSSSPRQ
jgi:hypothetical protein